MDRLTATPRVALLVAAPPCCAAVAWLAVIATAGLTGTHPIWSLSPRNLAEAAAFRDGGAVVRFVDAGHDLDQPAQVRGGIVLTDAATLTPVEAAAVADQAEMLQVLLDLGAAPGAAVWQRAYCLSDDEGVRAVLVAHRPPGVAEECPDH